VTQSGKSEARRLKITMRQIAEGGAKLIPGSGLKFANCQN